jgi:hypothetical protein
MHVVALACVVDSKLYTSEVFPGRSVLSLDLASEGVSFSQLQLNLAAAATTLRSYSSVIIMTSVTFISTTV